MLPEFVSLHLQTEMSWNELPSEILENVMQRLNLEELSSIKFIEKRWFNICNKRYLKEFESIIEEIQNLVKRRTVFEECTSGSIRYTSLDLTLFKCKMSTTGLYYLTFANPERGNVRRKLIFSKNLRPFCRPLSWECQRGHRTENANGREVTCYVNMPLLDPVESSDEYD